MFSHNFYIFTYVCLFLYITQSCVSEPLSPPQLVLFAAGEPEYTDVLVKRVGDNLTLECELRDELAALTSYVWNYIPDNGTAVRPYTVSPSSGPSASSKLFKPELQVSDSGQYLCSAPPFSVTKYILVQTRGPIQCARGAFWCGTRCVLPAYVCDGFVDCVRGEDESAQLCSTQVCARSDKLNCSSGRCISAAACCRRAAPLCRQPSCCDEYPRHAPLEGYVDVEFPKQFEDRRAPDDYGFIQSTIYTVTACALIFMLAVVLLVSAICKMHMKRAALRQYSQPDRLYHRHQAPRFPPCYEASRLLESSPPPPPDPEPPLPASPPPRPRGLARLTTIFNNRYRQVPSEPPAVEMTSYGAPASPSRALAEYRPPPLPLLEAGAGAGYARGALAQAHRQRLTLQLGRFQLTLPRFGRADDRPGRPGDRPDRPDTPTVAGLDLDLDLGLDVGLVRLHSDDTYTLNGRTIRLLGANFENYPPLLGGARSPPHPGGPGGPPSYDDAVRYKFLGPPPEYLSRERLAPPPPPPPPGGDARGDAELPPCYDDLPAGGGGATCLHTGMAVSDSNTGIDTATGFTDVTGLDVVDLPASDDSHMFSPNTGIDNATSLDPGTGAGNCNTATPNDSNGNVTDFSTGIEPVETLRSIIDNLPAIDSDVNANDTGIETDINTGMNTVIC